MLERVSKKEDAPVSSDKLLKYLLVADGIYINPQQAENKKFMKVMEDVLTVLQETASEHMRLEEL